MNHLFGKLKIAFLILGFVGCKSTANDSSTPKEIVPMKPGTKFTRVVKQYAIDPELQVQLANEFRDTMRFAVVEKADKTKALALYFRRDATKLDKESVIYFSELWKEGSDDIEIRYTDLKTNHTETVGSAFYDPETKNVTVIRLCNEEFYDVCDIDYLNAKINFKLNS